VEEPAWDHAALKAWFDARAGQNVVETDLLRHFFSGDRADALADGVGLPLFHQHFLLYRRLWLFDDELRRSTGQRLWIRGIRCTLVNAPPPGRCGWLNPETGQYCLEALDYAGSPGGLCSRHSGPVPEANSMKSYYLDVKNLEAMTDEGLRDLVEGFFRWMGRPDEVRQAYQTLGLAEDADARTLKARWRRLSQEHHPDKGGDPAVYQRLSAAWAVLKPRV
jgi:hypothetical protein